MQSDQYNENLSKYLKQENIKKEAEHESSGKISPSKLTKPTLEAVLQLLGVPPDPPSNQSLRYFLRGNVLEEIAVKAITFGRKTYKLQATAEYRGGIGYIDVHAGLPHEIKSAGQWTWRTVQKQGKPLHHHGVQATYYALSKSKSSAWVHYINSDTFQLISFRVQASDYKDAVNSRIDLITDSLISGRLPDYIPLEPYHKTIRYSDYSMFFNKKGEEAENILKQYYEKSYSQLKSKNFGKEV